MTNFSLDFKKKQNVVFSFFEEKLQKKLKQQEKELRQLKTTISTLEKTIQNEDEIFRSFDKKIGEMNEKHALELHMQTVKQRELEKELDQRGFMITKLTDQLQREKEQRRKLNRVPIIGQMILPDKPLKMKSKDESIRRPTQLHRNSSNRSSSLNIRDNRDDETIELLLLRRRPPTPPQQLRSPSILSSTSNHQSISTPRQRLETKLPPIAIRKMPLKASPGSLVQQNAEL